MKQRRTTKPADEAIWFAGGERGAEVGLLRARYERQFFPRHSHDGFAFGVNERGAHASWYKGATVVIPERTITVVPSEEVLQAAARRDAGDLRARGGRATLNVSSFASWRAPIAPRRRQCR